MNHSASRSPSADTIQPELTHREFLLFRELISTRTGISLRDTKCPMLTRRCSGDCGPSVYPVLKLITSFSLSQSASGDERRELINCITTNKTSFFREPHHFSFLADLFQRSIESRSLPRTFSVWSAACSSGEEPFSMAMTIQDTLNRSSAIGRGLLSILASDIDTQVLSTPDPRSTQKPISNRSPYISGNDFLARPVPNSDGFA